MLQALQQQTAVGQASQCIVKSESLNFLFGLLALGDVDGVTMRQQTTIGLRLRHRAGHVPAHTASSIGQYAVFALPGCKSQAD